MHPQLVVAQRVATIWSRPGRDEPGHEQRIRMCRDVPVAYLVVRQRLFLQIETIERLPGIANPDLQYEVFVHPDQAIRFVRRGLLDVEFELQRSCNCLLYTSDAADDLLCVD